MSPDPAGCVVRLLARWANWACAGSGFLVGPRHAVVARHAVRDSDHGGAAEEITVTLGGRSCRGVHTRGWRETGSGLARGDVALVTLERPLGDSWLPLWPADDEFLNDRPWAGVAGYSAKTGGRLLRSAGPIGGSYQSLGGFGALLWRMGDGLVTRPGMSGGPVWVREPGTGRPVVVGVVTGGTEAIGYAERVTGFVRDQLSAWMRDGK